MTLKETGGRARPRDAEQHPTDLWPTGLMRWTDRVLTRAGFRGEFARDCLLAVLVALVSVGILCLLLAAARHEEGLRLAPWGSAALTALVIVQSLTLCLRRTYVLACLAAVVVLQVPVLALLPVGTSFQGMASFIIAYTCATLLPFRKLFPCLLAVLVFQSIAAALTAGALAPTSTERAASPEHATVTSDLFVLWGSQFMAAVFGYVLAALVGSYVAAQRRYIGVERLRAAEHVQVQEARADAAIRAERARMARELHDVAAHHLSGMVVQAGAVERLISRDDDAAREATAWIRSQGRETLDSLRLIVSALREPTTEVEERGAAGAPVPGLKVLGRLVRAERDLGCTIETTREGGEYDLPPIADVTFYRVAQEALSNARDHAPGAPVRLDLRYSPAQVELEVVNGRGSGSGASKSTDVPRGLGLVGMRERAQLVGAALEAGPTDEGGWRVRLTLPVDREVSEGARHGTSGASKEQVFDEKRSRSAMEESGSA